MNQLTKLLVMRMLLLLMAKAQVKENTLTILPARRFSYLLSGTYQEGTFRTETECAVQLAKTESASAAVHYANNQSCFISDHPVDVIIHSTEPDTDCSVMYIYTKKIADGWKYIFGAKSGTNLKLYEAWDDSQYTCSNADCIDLYKNEIVNKWNTSNIEKVLLELFDENKVAAWLEFNANGANKSNWFSESRLTDSSWTDVITSSHNVFVQCDPDYMPSRKFYISHQHGGCPNDLLWMFVSEKTESSPPCPWDTYTSYPQFVYSGSDTTTNVNDFAFADWFRVFIKQGQ